MHRQIAGKLTGRVTKWFVLAFWIIAWSSPVAPAAKLTDVQNNEALLLAARPPPSRPRRWTSWQPFQDPNDIPTTIVYEMNPA